MSKYCYSYDGERFEGEYNSPEEIYQEHPGEEIYIGEAVPANLTWYDQAEDIVDSIIDNLSDQVGDVAECFEVTMEEQDDLDKMVNETVQRWIEKHKITPNCFKVENVWPVKVAEAGDLVKRLENMRDTEYDAACDRKDNNYEQSNGFVKAIRHAIEIVKGREDE